MNGSLGVNLFRALKADSMSSLQNLSENSPFKSFIQVSQVNKI